MKMLLTRTCLLLFATSTLLVQGCASVYKRQPVPEELVLSAQIPGIPRARSWGDEVPAHAKEWFDTPREEVKEEYGILFGNGHTYLAISGGGARGAYGAGVLVGWTEAGTRPEFSIVTGISTGALTAPFAFLGSDYDKQLEEVYTTYSTKDIVKKRPILDALTGSSMTSTRPLQQLIAKYFTQELVEAIAAEHRRGRRLNVGTANLDAGRPVIWNISEIADSGHPKALGLIRKIVLASASIPVAFPPVHIQVEADGQTFDEMHVDGGTASQVYLYPVGIDWARVLEKLEVEDTTHVYVIRNANLDPEWKAVTPKLFPIAGRTIDSLIRTQGFGDLYRIYAAAVRDELDFNLAYIPSDFEVEAKEAFDPVYMKALFDLGYEAAKSGYPWSKTPPGLDME